LMLELRFEPDLGGRLALKPTNFVVLSYMLATAIATPARGGEIILHNFASPPYGASPGRVIRDAAGNLYGTTYTGGAAGMGVVYKFSGGHFTTLYNFSGNPDGACPEAGLLRDSAGNLYGTTTVGGSGAGVVFKLDPTGKETILYTFSGGLDGRYPDAGVVSDSAGNLYGTTAGGAATRLCSTVSPGDLTDTTSARA